MAFDLGQLRAAARTEQRDAEQATRAVAKAIAKGEALGPDASAKKLARAADSVQRAGGKLGQLHDRVSIHLAAATPDEVLGSLEQDIPLVLLPVRLESRVVEQPAGQWQLLVRVYPDTIHSDVHERALTQAEEDAGVAVWALPNTQREAAWTGLVQLLGPERAAWVAEATRVDPATGNRVHPAAITGSRFTRPAWATTLPDQFIFLVRADGTDLPAQQGARIRSPVPTGPDPRLTPDADDGTDAGMRWMTDFDAAVAQGLGVRIALGATRPKQVDEVLAVGVRASSTPGDAATLLGGLLDAHRYTDGLELLAIGTPSNSTSASTSGYSTDRLHGAEPMPSASPVPPATPSDGARLARALGLEAARLAGVRGADGHSEADAQAMLAALWPGTLGYFLAQMLASSVSTDQQELLRAHAVGWVRARGPLSPLRAGRNPYGVLPVTSLARFVPEPGEAGADRFVSLLRGLLPAWRDAADQIPKAGRGDAGQATDALAQILALSPVSTAIDARRVYPQGVVDIITGLSGMSEQQQSTVSEVQRQLVQSSLTALGRLQEGDGLLHVLGAGSAQTITIPRVQLAPLSDTAPLIDDYLNWVRTATPDQLAREEERFGAPLLYLLVRYALLHQYANAAASSPDRPASFDVSQLLDQNVAVEIPGTLQPPAAALDLLATPTPAAPGGGAGPPLGQQMQQLAEGISDEITMGGGFGPPEAGHGGAPGPVPGGGAHPMRAPGRRGAIAAGPAAGAAAPVVAASPQTVETAEVLAALAHLAPLPSATLDRLLRETLDLGSHRLDAWVTSLAMERLWGMRNTQAQGAHLGAYGVARDIVPAAAAPMVAPPGSPPGTAKAADVPNQGFLPAPGPGHAATAAVLRSAHAAHGDGAPYAVTLESRRARRAKWLLDGVRQGQPLAALLGYTLERMLLDLGAASAIAKLRDAAPLRTSNAAPPASASFEEIAPRDVVDGLRIARDDFTRPALTADESKAVDTAVADLHDALDSTADLLLAEGVHQIVTGTPARAAVAAQAAAGVAPPPDRYDVLPTPRTGTALTHRLLLVSDSGSADWVAATAATPRVLAAPLLEGWAAARLGRPDDYAAVLEFAGPEGQPLIGADGHPLIARVEVSVAELGLGALDAIAMSSPAATGQLCELERRCLDRALSPARRPAQVPIDATARIVGRSEHAAVSTRIPVVDLIVAASSAGSLLGGARIAAAHELDPALAIASDAYQVNEMSSRLAAIIGVATPIRDELRRLLDGVPDDSIDLAGLMTQLRAASLIVSSALPEVADVAHPQGRLRLVPQGRGAWSELDRRLSAAAPLIQARSLGASTGDAANQRREIADLLVDNAPPAAPQLLGSVAQTLGGQLAAPPSLGTGVSSAADRRSVISSFLARARAVRPAVARLTETEAISTALGHAPTELRVGQSGTAAGDPWVALPVAVVPGGVTSIVVAGNAGFGAAPVAALVLDDWTEVVPREQEVSALAVHTERPSNDAPQSILIAVPPDRARAWDLATLRAVVEETLALAEMRMVDPPALAQFGHLLPALLLACTGRQAQIKVPEDRLFPKVPS